MAPTPSSGDVFVVGTLSARGPVDKDDPAQRMQQCVVPSACIPELEATVKLGSQIQPQPRRLRVGILMAPGKRSRSDRCHSPGSCHRRDLQAPLRSSRQVNILLLLDFNHYGSGS